MAQLTEPRPARVYLVLALGLASITASPILVRYAGEAPGLTVAVWRTVFAALLLAPSAWLRCRPELRRLSRRDRWWIGIAGVLLGLHFVTWIESLYHTSVASASVLVWTNPIFLALLGRVFLKEHLSRYTVLGIALSVFGAVLIGWGDLRAASPAGDHATLGNGLALSAALFLSVYLIIGRVVRQRLSWLAYVFPLYTVVACTTVVLALLRGTPLLGFDARIYGLCLLMALGPSLLGHGSFNYVVRYLPAALIGVLSLLEPVGASLLALVLFDEVPGLLAVLGMALVLVGVIRAMRRVRPATQGGAGQAGGRSDPVEDPRNAAAGG